MILICLIWQLLVLKTFLYKDNQNSLEDNEGTVDGVHLADLGVSRYANYLLENFKN